MRRALFYLVALIALGANQAVAATAVGRTFQAPLMGVEIEATPLFSEPGDFGAFPIELRIKNSSGRGRTWAVSITSNRNGSWNDSYVTRADLTVADGETRRFELFTVLLPDGTDSYSGPQSVRVRVDGYGVGNSETTFAQPYRDYKLAKLPHVVLSPDIALRSGSVLTEEFNKASKAFPAVTVQLSMLPEDWRQLTGTSGIWLSFEEWRGLTVGKREAIANWVLAGGRLVIFSKGGESINLDTLQLPFVANWDGLRGRHGLGEIQIGSWNGSEVSFAEAFSLMNETGTSPFDPGERILNEIWRLLDRVPAPELNAFLVATLLFVYAVIVGPLNLRFAGRRGGRYLIFVTTPVIAALSCIALFGLIVMKDGFGGWGARNLAVMIAGGSNRALVTQEQISRTGILLEGATSLKNDYLMIPLNLYRRGYRSERGTYETIGNSFTEGWAGNRSRQSQLAFGVVPTRARVSVDMASATVLSSIEAELKTLFVKDSTGNWWQATKVMPGRQTPLKRSSNAEYITWSQGTLQRNVSPVLAQQLAALQKAPSAFFAEAASDGGFLIPAFSQFDWETVTAIFYGPL